MKLFLVRFFLALLGIIFLFIFIVSFIILIKTTYFSGENLGDYLFNNNLDCDKNSNISQTKLCIQISKVYLMIVLSIVSSTISFISLFPFLNMKKKKK